MWISKTMETKIEAGWKLEETNVANLPSFLKQNKVIINSVSFFTRVILKNIDSFGIWYYVSQSHSFSSLSIYARHFYSLHLKENKKKVYRKNLFAPPSFPFLHHLSIFFLVALGAAVCHATYSFVQSAPSAKVNFNESLVQGLWPLIMPSSQISWCCPKLGESCGYHSKVPDPSHSPAVHW